MGITWKEKLGWKENFIETIYWMKKKIQDKKLYIEIYDEIKVFRWEKM